MHYSANFQKFSLTVFVLSGLNNTFQELTKLSAEINEHLKKDTIAGGPVIVMQKSADS
jgi:hypothetical protein